MHPVRGTHAERGGVRTATLACVAVVAVGTGLAWYAMAPPSAEPARAGAGGVPEPSPTVPSPQPLEPDAPSDFVEITTITEDAARNRALYGLLAGADQSRIEDLLKQAGDLPASPHRTDVVRILYIHLAALNPQAAADHVLNARYQRSWLATVFRAWAHSDFEAAVRHAASLDASPRSVVAQAFLEMDLPAWQQEMIAEKLDAAMLLAAVRGHQELATGTPQQAWTNALALPAGGDQNRRLGMAALAWAKDDPAAALRAVDEFTGDAGRWMAGRVMTDWAKSDRRAALRWLSEQEGSDRSKWHAAMLAGAIAETDVNAALDAIDQMPAWAQQDAKSAILRNWLRTDLPAVLDWFGSQPLADQESFHYTVAHMLARHDPEQAFGWAITTDRRVRERILDSVFREISDRATAESLFRRVDDPELKAGLVFELYWNHAPDDPKAALRWANGFDPTTRDELRSLAYQRWAERDPAGAIREVARHRDPALRDGVAANVIEGLLDAFHVEEAERLFAMIETADVRRSAAFSLLWYFRDTDPDPAKAATYRAIAENP